MGIFIFVGHSFHDVQLFNCIPHIERRKWLDRKEIRLVSNLLFVELYHLIKIVVSLTKTGAKGRTLKSKLIEVLRAAVDEYKSIYLFRFENMRASKFKDVRMDWRESK